MTWDEFRKELDDYERAWSCLRRATAGPVHEYLAQSTIVVTCGRSFELEDDLKTVARKCPAFFADDPLLRSSDVRINDAWRVEIRFPYVDIDLIQAVKNSVYCDHEKTSMKASSGVVVLSKGRVQ